MELLRIENHWLDIVLFIIFFLYAFEGIQAGFMRAFLDFLSFVLSFLFSLTVYSKVAPLILEITSLSQGFANAISFFLVAIISEIIITLFFKIFLTKFLNTASDNIRFSNMNKIFGVFPGVLSAFVLLSFLLTIIVSLPLSPFLKRSISSSIIGNFILARTFGMESSLNSIFGGAVKDTLNFLTVEPQSDESVSLHFKVENAPIDEQAQQEMFIALNIERKAKNLIPLVMDIKLSTVAQSHGRDMLKRGYFSHYTPEGLSPFDRMGIGNISFLYAGENLAFSVNTGLAMQGLMQSLGHRENILSPHFGKVGIGVLDAGIYGEMFVQEFSD